MAQVYGAERWIRKYPTQLFLDVNCTQPFPLKLGDPTALRFHRIVVAIGAADRCREHLGGSGSLLIYPQLAEPDSNLPHNKPFIVGGGTKDGGHVHIFDDVTLDIVLGELDTITDFVRYLRKKEAFIPSSSLLASEEDLLAYYLQGYDPQGEHEFALPKGSTVVVDQSMYSELLSDARYIAEKEANRISYSWDRLIEHFSGFVLDGTVTGSGTETSPAAHEKRLRPMAIASRRTRRMLGSVLDEFFRAEPMGINVRAVTASTQPHLGYVFLLMSRRGHANYNEYRDARRVVLHAYCIVYRLKNPQLRTVIGIAGEPQGEPGPVSEDLITIDESQWTPELASQAKKLERQCRLLTDAKWHRRGDPAASSAPNPSMEGNRRERRARAAKARQQPR